MTESFVPFGELVETWKENEVLETLAYVAKIREQIAVWREEYGYNRMVTLVDFQKIGRQWKELAMYMSEVAAEKEVRKIVDHHFKVLQGKVEKKIGNIISILPLSNNGADYIFHGENGTCEIRIIGAGGYNIQRFHTRWIFVK
jgi:hypothetical protein